MPIKKNYQQKQDLKALADESALLGVGLVTAQPRLPATPRICSLWAISRPRKRAQNRDYIRAKTPASHPARTLRPQKTPTPRTMLESVRWAAPTDYLNRRKEPTVGFRLRSTQPTKTTYIINRRAGELKISKIRPIMYNRGNLIFSDFNPRYKKGVN